MLIFDLVIKCNSAHTRPIIESTVNTKENVRDKDSVSSAYLSRTGQKLVVILLKLEIIKIKGDYRK